MLIIISAMLFAGLVIASYLTCWIVISPTNNNGMILDFHPIPGTIKFILNRQLPCFIFVIVTALTLTRKKQKNIRDWVSLVIIVLSVCGFLILAQQICSELMGQNLFEAKWWP